MAREINRSGELDVFVRVVEAGGFSAAARELHLTPSAVSKLVTRLEARLGARLINRSTRQWQLTAEGCVFYERGLRILADLDEAERVAASGEAATGRIRLNTSASYATHVLMPRLPEFLAAHPGISLDLMLTDQVVDLLAARVDVAVRAGPLKDSRLIARKLGASRHVVVASPDYLARRGKPRQVRDLATHDCLGLDYARRHAGWPLAEQGRNVIVKVTGRVLASDGEALRQLALAGAGLARLPIFTVRQDIAAGRLAPVLERANPGDREEFHAVYLGQGNLLPARIRAFLDFLARNGKVT